MWTPKRPLRSATSALFQRSYFRLSALLDTPPPADFTHTDVPAMLVVPRKAQVPPLTGVVAMRVPGQAPAAAVPSWISTLAAKVPLARRLVVPSTRSCVPARSARVIVTVSAPAAGGGGATALTVWVTTADVLVRKSRLPL